MSIVAFSPQLLEAWADYSGDRNPIHFDAGIVRRHLGSACPVAHGMLALQPIKCAWSNALPAANGGSTWRWTALLRRPLPIDRHYRVRVLGEDKSGYIKSSLDDDATGIRHITASACRETGALPRLAGPARHLLDGDAVAARYRRFRQLFPRCPQTWLFYDALLFVQLLQTHRDALLHALGASATTRLDAAGTLLMQISHTVLASGATFACREAPPQRALRYDLRFPGTVTSGDSRCATVQMTLYDQDDPLLTQEMTLMLKQTVAAPECAVTRPLPVQRERTHERNDQDT